MIKKIITLFKLGRKIAKSDILKIASKFKKPPLAITLLFQILSISFERKEQKLDKIVVKNWKITITEKFKLNIIGIDNKKI